MDMETLREHAKIWDKFGKEKSENLEEKMKGHISVVCTIILCLCIVLHWSKYLIDHKGMLFKPWLLTYIFRTLLDAK